MAQKDLMRVNGRLVSRASVIFKIDDVPIYGVVSIDWDQGRPHAKGMGLKKSGPPLGRTSGEYEAGMLKVRFFTHTAQTVRKNLAERVDDGRSYGNAVVDATLEIDEPEFPQLTEFFEITVEKETSGIPEGPEATAVDFEFSMMKLREDGLTLYDSSEEP